jgi:outer membrane protein TolC
MKKTLIILLLITGVTGGKAQHKLTLESCRQLALKQSEDMKIARFRADKAEAEQAAMKTQAFPVLSGSATGVYLYNDIEQEMILPTQVPDMTTGQLRPNVMVNPATGEVVRGTDGNPVFNMYAWLPLEISLRGAYLAGITLQQPIYTGGKIAAGNALTKIGVEMAADNLELQRANTLFEADQAFWLYVSVQEKVKLAEAYEELLNRLEERVTNAFETGMTTRNELLKVTVKHNEAKLQLQKARSGLELTRMALCRITGLPFDTSIETGVNLQDENLTLPWENIAGIQERDESETSETLKLRPEYRLLQRNVEVAGQKVKLARAAFLPTAGISLGYNYVGGISIGTEDFTSSNPTFIASLKIPIFHWGEGRQKQLAARREMEISQAELAKNSRLMTLEMEQARLNVHDARLRVRIAKSALEQAGENLRVSNDNFAVGMGLLSDLLEAQVQWQSANSETIEAAADLRLKETAWLKASGQLK